MPEVPSSPDNDPSAKEGIQREDDRSLDQSAANQEPLAELHGALPPDTSKLRQRLSPLQQELGECIRGELTARFLQNSGILLERAIDYFSTILSRNEDLSEYEEANYFVVRHKQCAAILDDLVVKAVSIRDSLPDMPSGKSCDLAKVERVYDVAIVPWLQEFRVCLKSIWQLDIDIIEFLEAAANVDMAEDELDETEEDDQDYDLLQDEESEVNKNSFSLLQEPLDDNDNTAVAYYRDQFSAAPRHLRELMAKSQSMLLLNPTDLNETDLNLAVLDFHLSSAMRGEFADYNIQAPIEPTEFMYCLNRITMLMREYFETTYGAVVRQAMQDGVLYNGSGGYKIRQSLLEHCVASAPLRVNVNNDGSVSIIHDIPSVLEERWVKNRADFEEVLHNVKNILESRGHSITVGFDSVVLRFSEVTFEHERPPSWEYCTAQSDGQADPSKLYGTVRDKRYMTLPRAASNLQRPSHNYTLLLEEAGHRVLDRDESYRTLLSNIDQFVGSLDRDTLSVRIVSVPDRNATRDRVGLANSPESLLPVVLRTSDSYTPSSRFSLQELRGYLQSIPSAFSDEWQDTSLGFSVDLIDLPDVPKGVALILDSQHLVRVQLKEHIAALGKKYSLHLALSHQRTSMYSGIENKQAVIDYAVSEVHRIAQSDKGNLFAGITVNFFSGVQAQSEELCPSGFMARFYNHEGIVVAQGVLDENEGLSPFIAPTGHELIPKIDASIDLLDRDLKYAVRDFQAYLTGAGLNVDDMRLFQIFWHYCTGMLISEDSALSDSAAILKKVIRLPGFVYEERDGIVTMRPVDDLDIL